MLEITGDCSFKGYCDRCNAPLFKIEFYGNVIISKDSEGNIIVTEDGRSEPFPGDGFCNKCLKELINDQNS